VAVPSDATGGEEDGTGLVGLVPVWTLTGVGGRTYFSGETGELVGDDNGAVKVLYAASALAVMFALPELT